MTQARRVAPAPTSAESILASALGLIVDLGYSAMSMRCLARDLGLQAGSIYHHFASKSEVLEQVIESVIDRRFHSWQRAKPKRTGAVDRLEHFVAHHVRHQLVFGNEDRLVLAELRHLDNSRRLALNTEIDRYVDEAACVIAACRRRSSHALDVRIGAASMISLLDGAAQFRADGLNSSDHVVRMMFQLTCQLLDIDTRTQG